MTLENLAVALAVTGLVLTAFDIPLGAWTHDAHHPEARKYVIGVGIMAALFYIAAIWVWAAS